MLFVCGVRFSLSGDFGLAKRQPLVRRSSSDQGLSSLLARSSDLRVFRMTWASICDAGPGWVSASFLWSPEWASSDGCIVVVVGKLRKAQQIVQLAHEHTYGSIVYGLLADNERFCLSFCAARAVFANPAKQRPTHGSTHQAELPEKKGK